LQQEDRYPITDIFDQTPDIPDNCQWAIFLRNHDELTLEMVTDEERDFMYKAYAKDPKARINLGIRHRLAPLMDNDRKRIELMNALLFSLPGTPVVYYGDEIGMGDNFYLGDRDGVRTPMQWSPDRNAGFSAANPHQLYLPVILDPEYTYEAVNVELQRQNTSSLFWFMKRIIHMRRSFEAFSRGSMQFLHVENPKVLAFIRSFGDEQILVVNNLSKHSQPAEIDLDDFAGYVPVEVFSKNKFPAVREGSPYFFTLSAHSFQWFRLRKEKAEAAPTDLPALDIPEHRGLESKSVLQLMEKEILPAYFKGKNWFKGEVGATYAVMVSEVLPIDVEGETLVLLLAEVTYESGMPETYQVVLSFVPESDARSIVSATPGAALATARRGSQNGILCDAFYTPAFQRFMMTGLATQGTAENSTGLVFESGNAIPEFYGSASQQRPAKISVVDENNTSLSYDNRFFLKLYRKVDYGINPDVEISTYLADQKGFEHVPASAGLIQLKTKKGPVVLGMVQQLVENHGNGKTYMLERVNNFIERILARDIKSLDPTERSGSFAAPASFDSLPEGVQLLLGARAAGQASLLGKRTAEMHLALSKDPHLKDFVGEEFSLHYQRSLFSSMQSLVRETFQTLYKQLGGLPRAVQEDVEYLTGRKDDLLEILRRIYSKKLDVQKIRVHGNFELDKVLLTGKDIVIQDFGGNTRRSFSERRLKRSPMRDIADMICSLQYVAYEGFQQSNHVQNEDKGSLAPFAEQWSFYMSSFFLHAYYEKTGDAPFLPLEEGDREMFVTTYVLERAIHHLNYELEYRPEYVAAPLGMIRSILGK
ncbi:MAG TPA: alpha-glucosidase C-terminal domain-containing protein, partial [Flavisolibacter sp.]